MSSEVILPLLKWMRRAFAVGAVLAGAIGLHVEGSLHMVGPNLMTLGLLLPLVLLTWEYPILEHALERRPRSWEVWIWELIGLVGAFMAFHIHLPV